ncbi:MAG: surface carbohydrate biosynthesis protein [Gemmatimonadota bacterium]
MIELNRDLPTVLLSIETASRELDSKLLLGTALAGRGLRAIVGHKEAVKDIACASRRVVWLGKSILNVEDSGTSVAQDLARNESLVIWHHDEGGIYPEQVWETYFLRSHPPHLIARQNCVRVCVWGERQKRVLEREAPELNGSVVATGSPRFDLCAPAFEWVEATAGVEDRVERTPYILVNTRFVMAAPYQGQDWLFREPPRMEDWPEGTTPERVRDLTFSNWRQVVHDFAEFVSLVKELALAHGDHTLVLRPHPSENLNFYREVFRPFPNVHVTRDHNVTYWIRGARMVVHCKCTTGIEAALAGRPVLHFWPNPENDLNGGEEVAREAGWLATSIPDALQRSSRILDGHVETQKWSPSARELLQNLSGPAIPRIVDETIAVLDAHGINGSDVVFPPGERRKPLANLRRRFGRSRLDYVTSKRGRLEPTQVERIVAGCGEHGFGRVEIRRITRRFVVLEPSEHAG